jgi:hypothetical protein
MTDSLVAAALEGPDEEAVGGAWLSAARAWTDRVKGRVLGPSRAGLPPDPVMVLSENGLWVEQLTEKVRPSVLGVLRRAFQRLTGTPPPDGFDQSQYVTDYLNASVNRMSGVPDEVYRQISGAIAAGVGEGESIPNLAARVDEILTVTGSANWSNRSVVVARTEVTGANSAGAIAAGAQRQITERRPMVKTWVATTRPPSSERTRPAHLEADGQTVPLMEAFMVGGEPLQYPGDPAGSAGNVIQCRCTPTIRAADEPPTETAGRQFPGGRNG